jgi:hypothetical protein
MKASPEERLGFAPMFLQLESHLRVQPLAEIVASTEVKGVPAVNRRDNGDCAPASFGKAA